MNTMTTISISSNMRDKIREFGMKGESYEDILERWYESVCKRQLHDILFDDTDCLSLDEAREFIKQSD